MEAFLVNGAPYYVWCKFSFLLSLFFNYVFNEMGSYVINEEEKKTANISMTKKLCFRS